MRLFYFIFFFWGTEHISRPRQQGDMTPLPTSNSNHSTMAVTPASLRQQPPQRVSKAIPIVAPPPAPAATTEHTISLTQVAKSPSPPSPTATKKNNNTNGTSSSNNGVNPQVQEVEQLLSSLDGKPTHEKKQQLGDRLFPLVKVN